MRTAMAIPIPMLTQIISSLIPWYERPATANNNKTWAVFPLTKRSAGFSRLIALISAEKIEREIVALIDESCEKRLQMWRREFLTGEVGRI